MKPYEKRKGDEHSATAIVNKVRGRLFRIQGALVLAFEPPAVQGLGTFGGFAYEVQDQGGHTLQELAETTNAMVRAGNTRKEKDLAGLYTSYTPTIPSSW